MRDFSSELKQIADDNGIHTVLLKTIEELSELQYSVSRQFARAGGSSTHNLWEEVADVMIMLDQLVYLMDGEEEVEDWRRRKINRQLARMELEKKLLQQTELE